MKKLVLSILLAFSVFTYNASAQKYSSKEIKVSIDLNVVKDDRVMVTVIPPVFSGNEVIYHFPKTVPGTYSDDNYGKLIDDFKAFDKKGNELTTSKTDVNSWKISNAKSVANIVYWVNDSFDSESGQGYGSSNKSDIFSPAGTNIAEARNFMINNHGFIGFFEDKSVLTELPYSLTILHPAGLFGATSLVDEDKSDMIDRFKAGRYFDLTDNPIMYSKPDYETFTVDGMEILFSVYSPNGMHSAKSLLPDLEKTMRAQKAFMGSINNNKRYTVILYLTELRKKDAMGYGALEHETSTVVVFPEFFDNEKLSDQIRDVVSHEFFHTITPLSIHSEEIQNFDYSNPKMSKHLWMYEGITEYFSSLFQINQGLIDDDEFYERMAEKIRTSALFNDTMPFTEMSENVLKNPYKAQYPNVYEKGAVIAMCIDIIIREHSNGERGILDLMRKLSLEYGPEKAFKDDELFAKVTELTYPEVGEFLTTYVAGNAPIPYDVYFARMGVSKAKITVPQNPFLKNDVTPLLSADPDTKEIYIVMDTPLNDFMTNLGLKPGDDIIAINDQAYNLDSVFNLVMDADKFKEGDDITLKIKRNGLERIIKGKVKLSTSEIEGYQFTDASKEKLNQGWLKG